MAEFSVTVSTGEAIGAGTWNKIAVSLVGTRGETPPLRLDHPGKEFSAGAVSDFQVASPQDVGPLLLLRVHKAPLLLPAPVGPVARDAWFCRWFQLTPPQGAPLRFPCYQWLEGAGSLALRAGAGERVAGEERPAGVAPRDRWGQPRVGAGMLVGPGARGHPSALALVSGLLSLLVDHLPAPLSSWKTYSPGWPHCLDEKSVKDLDLNIKYSVMKNSCFYLKVMKAEGAGRTRSNSTLKAPRWGFRADVTWPPSPAALAPEYTFEHWQEDTFFNFPVTDDMVAPVLGPGTSLQAELEVRDMGIQALHTAVPVPLAHPLLERALRDLPSARGTLSQAHSSPCPDPIFLPSDNKWDWLLAKTWVRNAEFSVHEAVFTMATLRQLPHCHPLFKLLIPHTLYTLHINTLARELLIAPGQVSTGIGIGGFSELIQRNMEQLNYSVLCLPEDIQARGVKDIPNYYYPDDGLKIWGAVESFVSEIINIYYPSDASVCEDGELQAWVWEIFSEGFLGRESSGMPFSLETREALVQYVTMVIFNCSAKHYAVSAGQFDSCVWMPNLPASMQLPPPTSKGQTRPEGFLATLPPVNATCDIIVALWLLSKEPGDQRPLGTYPEEHFTEEAPQQSIATFQSRLTQISKEIRERNQELALPYTYLDPPLIENSVSI
uniref:Polyunsaturated fatty acid lipoxygenase ALOX15 n=1 Tax=Canis lupus familiaris TaxID=9615 RepID=A0A8C0P251_CANLF